MGHDEQLQRGPHRTYTDLRVVADELERDEHLTIGVIVDGAFVPIAQHPLGSIEQMKARWNELGGTKVNAVSGTALQGLENRLANLERAALAAGLELDQPAPPAPPAAGE